jgi:LysM repeat protein
MRRNITAIAGFLLLLNSGALLAQAPLKGSRTAMKKQNSVAQQQDYTFLRTTSDVRRFVDNGYLVPVKGTSALKLAGVSFPYARPAVKTFAERLASQYQNACGNKLVVTSLTRPLSRQPGNAHKLSVHPAGMALDIRVSDRTACRRWLENTLVSLEKKGVLEATRERNPAHYHVAVFPSAYFHYLGKDADQPRIVKVGQPKYASMVPMPGNSGGAKAATTTSASKSVSKKTAAPLTHKVAPGESLWSIARRHGVSVPDIKRANGMNGTTIRPGQVIAIPRERSTGAD